MGGVDPYNHLRYVLRSHPSSAQRCGVGAHKKSPSRPKHGWQPRLVGSGIPRIHGSSQDQPRIVWSAGLPGSVSHGYVVEAFYISWTGGKQTQK